MEYNFRRLENSGITQPLDEVYKDLAARSGYTWKDMVHDIMTGKVLI